MVNDLKIGAFLECQDRKIFILRQNEQKTFIHD